MFLIRFTIFRILSWFFSCDSDIEANFEVLDPGVFLIKGLTEQIISIRRANIIVVIEKGVRTLDGSIYKIVELVGTSPKSWEEAVQNVVNTASKTVRDLRIAEVRELDVRLENGKIAEYRAKVRLSFKYEKED